MARRTFEMWFVFRVWDCERGRLALHCVRWVGSYDHPIDKSFRLAASDRMLMTSTLRVVLDYVLALMPGN